MGKTGLGHNLLGKIGFGHSLVGITGLEHNRLGKGWFMKAKLVGKKHVLNSTSSGKNMIMVSC